LTQTAPPQKGQAWDFAITARLVELHRSKLEIESKPGEWNLLYFLLPLLVFALDEPARTTKATPRAGKTPRILIVEDNAATGNLSSRNSRLPVMRPCDVIQPERATEMAAEHQPDAITLDLLMQPVHGLEVLFAVEK